MKLKINKNIKDKKDSRNVRRKIEKIIMAFKNIKSGKIKPLKAYRENKNEINSRPSSASNRCKKANI